MNSPVTEAVRTVHWTLLSSPATLSSAMLSFDFRAWLLCSLRKFQGRPHLPLLYRDRAHAQYTWTLFACCVLLPGIGYKFLDAGTSIRLLNCSYFSIICVQRYNQAWPHAPSYIFFTCMRILQVVYGIYTTCSDQSDFSIWFNYDLSSTYTKKSAPCP